MAGSRTRCSFPTRTVGLQRHDVANQMASHHTKAIQQAKDMHHDHQRCVLSPEGLMQSMALSTAKMLNSSNQGDELFVLHDAATRRCRDHKRSLDARVANHPRLLDHRREPGPHDGAFLSVGTSLVPTPTRHERTGRSPQLGGAMPASPSNMLPCG